MVAMSINNTKHGKRKSGKVANTFPNPFRSGSAYAVCYDILCSHLKGLKRSNLIELHAKASGKDIRRAGYDCAVLLSAKESNTGPRHRSCKNGFWIERENDFVRIRF